MRHKTNWERVMAALDSIRGNAEAVGILRQELAPKYAAIVAKRAKVRAAVYAWRKTEEGRRARQEYAKKYREENREKCNAASSKSHKSRREREREAARTETTTEQENQK